MNRKSAFLFLTLLFVLVFSGTTWAFHRWGCYKLQDATFYWYNGGTGDYYNIYQEEAITDSDSWHNATVMDFVQVGTNGFSDQVNSYNDFYGITGWFGLTTIYPSGCIITAADTDLNQTYLDSYGRTAKEHVACHELGHSFGLGHNNVHTDTCMNDSILNAPHPNQHDIDELADMYSPPPPSCTNCVALQANNGQWWVAAGGGGGVINADSNSVGSWEEFDLIDLGGGYIALQCANGQYVVAEGSGGQELRCDRNAIGSWETFEKVDMGGGNIALRCANGQYVVAEGGGGQDVRCDRNTVAAWETFYLDYL